MMDNRIKAILLGIFVGIGLIILNFAIFSFVNLITTGSDYYGLSFYFLPHISSVSIAALFTAWYYKRTNEGKLTIPQQFLPPLITAIIVGVLSLRVHLLTFLNLLFSGNIPSEFSSFFFPFLLQTLFESSIAGFFFGAAGYHLKDTPRKLILLGIVAMLLVFVLSTSLGFIYFTSFWQTDSSMLNVVNTGALAFVAVFRSIVDIILLGILFTSLYKPFFDFLKGQKTHFYIYPAFIILFGLAILTVASLSLPLPGQLPQMYEDYGLSGSVIIIALILILMSFVLNRKLVSFLKEHITVAYSIALAALYSVPALIFLILADFLDGFTVNRPWFYVCENTIPGGYGQGFVYPGILFILSIAFFPAILHILTRFIRIKNEQTKN